MCMYYVPAMPLLRKYHIETLSHVHQEIFTRIFTALLFVKAKTLEMIQISNNSKMDKLWHTHTME